ncbi:unnamed protein product [Plutella xylostella]|uniref:(diamondback moth) hypothetical protein n=1 Tax=Plutella xylostella TaxID=51655 RepID=A0A8S4GEM0_PLUXY|nr:unnamed protein product [Plutella xylostella]
MILAVEGVSHSVPLRNTSGSVNFLASSVSSPNPRNYLIKPLKKHSGLAGAARCDDSVSALGSRRSLADTSVTSTADLSVFSSGRSHAPDNSLDTHSNVSDGDTGSNGSGICGMSIQRAPSTAHSTPRATPHPHSASPHPSSVSPHPVSVSPLSDDVVRIHVTYNPLAASPSHLHPISPSKRFDEHSKLTLGLFTNGTSSDNRIRIQVPSEDLLTPVVDSGRIITQHYMDKDVYDLK